VGVRWRNRFEHVLVDEYQDTCHLQHELTMQLGTRAALTVVGDSQQSIYKFRGAKPENVELFREDGDVATVMLDVNYRSTKEIVECCDRLIANNPKVAGRTAMRSARGAGLQPEIKYLATHEDEAQAIVEAVQERHANGMPYGEMAVLVRMHALANIVAERLRGAYIPYSEPGTGFYQRAVVKDVLAHLRLVTNPDAETDLDRIVNKPARSIGKKAKQILAETSRDLQCSSYRAIEQAVRRPGMPKAGRASLWSFRAMFETAREQLRAGSASKVIRALLGSSRYLAMLDAKVKGADGGPRETEKADERVANAYEILASLERYERDHSGTSEEALAGYLQQVALMSEQDGLKTDRVALLTCHAAKGLQFRFVWMLGVENGILPSGHAGAPEDVQEERRLCYVACSRAKDDLVLSHVAERLLYGRYASFPPSRFLQELLIPCASSKQWAFSGNSTRPARGNVVRGPW
jgi:DNA helicase-2/ATP-dependent DNA helicase PcrA